MQLQFYKYQGAGNDFILLDNRDKSIQLSKAQVKALCDRRFGIGADGLMLLEPARDADFTMEYYNSDGGLSTMCGNGGRCIVAFAKDLGVIEETTNFIAVDGPHDAQIIGDGQVSLEMISVKSLHRAEDHVVLDTGSPHYIYWTNDPDSIDVKKLGAEIRYQLRFAPGGINVNFVVIQPDGSLRVRTYERGVEDETYSCGTGVTASAIASTGTDTGAFHINVQTPGGMLAVSFIKDSADTARDVVLHGPAKFVFRGQVRVGAEGDIQAFPVLT
jgi:diaminopimelate epimerase